MTLIIALGNKDHAIIASDRRLVVENKISDEESTKSILLTCDDARIGLAYTGLAKVGSFETHKWLLENLGEICKLNSNIENILKDLAVSLTSKFNNFSFKNLNYAKLTLLAIGFQYLNDKTELGCWRISNFEYGDSLNVKDSFQIIKSKIPEDGFIIEKAGFITGVQERDMHILKKMLSMNSPTIGFENKLYDTIIKASKNIKSMNMVGPQANTIVIPKVRNEIMRATYYSSKNSHNVFGASSVLSAKKSPMITLGSKLIISQDNLPVMIPKVHNNKLCPCKSGIKYKYCHKKFRYPYLPMRSEIRFDEKYHGYINSGNIFIIESRGAAV